MRLVKRLTFLPVFFFTVACAYGQEIRDNHDGAAKFAAYKTYDQQPRDAIFRGKY